MWHDGLAGKISLILIAAVILLVPFAGVQNPKALAASPAPHISSIKPGNVSAGTGASVTVTGVNFGSVKGSSRIEFWWHVEYVPGTVTRWSDTEIVCTVPRCSSGNAAHGIRVVTSAGNSNDYPIDITFGVWPDKWAGPDTVVRFFMNENGAPPGALQAILNAAQAWNRVRGADFYFEFGGLITSPCAVDNGRCEVFWQSYADPPAYAWAPFISESCNIKEADIIFNSNMDWSADGSTDIDVESYAVHEFGHWLGLIDLYGASDAGKIMFGYPYGHHTLAEEDMDAMRWLYPGTGSRGQYYVRVTNNTGLPQVVYFKSDLDSAFTRSFKIPAGQTVNSWWEVVPAGKHSISVRWLDPADNTSRVFSSKPLDIPLEGETEFGFILGEAGTMTTAPARKNNALDTRSIETPAQPVPVITPPVAAEEFKPRIDSVASDATFLTPAPVIPAVRTDVSASQAKAGAGYIDIKIFRKYLVAVCLLCIVVILLALLFSSKKAK